MKQLYILKGDLAGFSYTIFGAYTTKDKLIEASEKILHKYCNDKELKETQDEYNFSGLMYYVANEENINKIADWSSAFDEHIIEWDAKNHSVVLK